MKRLKYLGIFVFVVVGLMLFSGLASAQNCECEECCDVYSPGYWKNHPDAWPVEVITIGGVDFDKDDAIEIMKQPVKGDKKLTLFKALVSAKLNVLYNNGADCCDVPCPYCGQHYVCISYVIEEADSWFADNSGVVKASSDAWQEGGESLYEALDDYNNREFCDDGDCPG